MAYLNTTQTSQNTVLTRIAQGFDTLITKIQERRLARETFNGLNALSTRELADLGLTRSELHHVARTSARNAVR